MTANIQIVLFNDFGTLPPACLNHICYKCERFGIPTNDLTILQRYHDILYSFAIAYAIAG